MGDVQDTGGAADVHTILMFGQEAIAEVPLECVVLGAGSSLEEGTVLRQGERIALVGLRGVSDGPGELTGAHDWHALLDHLDGKLAEAVDLLAAHADVGIRSGTVADPAGAGPGRAVRGRGRRGPRRARSCAPAQGESRAPSPSSAAWPAARTARRA